MNRLILLAAMATACTVVTRPSIDDTPPEADGGRRDAGAKFDAGDVDAGEPDAGETDAGEPDAGDADAGPPKSARTWGAPVLIANVNSPTWDSMPTLSEDLLRLCFASSRGGTEDIYCATRTSTDQTFGTPTAQANINTGAREMHPVIWRDELFFSSDRPGSDNLDVYHATWNSLAGTYATPTRVVELSTPAIDVPASISSDGLTLYLQSGRAGGRGGADLWVTTRLSTSSLWSFPVNLTTINSKADDLSVAVSPDASFILVASSRPVPGRADPYALWIADADPNGGWLPPQPADIRRPKELVIYNVSMLPDGALIVAARLNGAMDDLYYVPTREPDPPSPYQFGRPEPLTSVNSGSDDMHPSMTADRLKICFGSTRPGGSGDADIWCATRVSPTDPFGSAVNMSAINSSGWDGHAALSQDGAELFFTSSKSGAGDIFRAVWVPAEGQFKFPESVNAVNTSNPDGDIALTSNDLTMVFARNTTNTSDGWDLYVSTRPNRSTPFGAPSLLTGLNTGYLDSDPGPSLDGYRLIFCSWRPAAWETGAQSRRLWGSDLLGNGQWSSPALVEFEGFFNAELFGPALLSDGSLLFHAWNWDQGNMDLYLAPPR
jgi:Tol biopolymer transport system component